MSYLRINPSSDVRKQSLPESSPPIDENEYILGEEKRLRRERLSTRLVCSFGVVNASVDDTNGDTGMLVLF